MKRCRFETLKNSARYVIITPVRDEGAYIERTIKSVISQTIQPVDWIIVNDGSSDNTGEIINRYGQQYGWIRPMHRENRGFRNAGGGVIEAFYEGYNLLTGREWDFIVKLDGDLSFDRDYFENCLGFFLEDITLGIGGGTICSLSDGQLKIDSVGDPLFHVRGATKIYRRGCWEQIGPLVKAPGWDTIDEVKANMHGWKTQTFKNLKVIQHKETGSADGIWRTWHKNGLANYIAGYHPLFMGLKCTKRIFKRPYFIGSIGLFYGYISGYWKKIPQINDRSLINYLRKQQLGRLFFRESIWK